MIDMFIIWVLLFAIISGCAMVTSALEVNWFTIIIRALPLFLYLWFILFSDSYIKLNKKLYSEIYEKGNLKELSVKTKESKEYNEYKFQRDWEEKTKQGEGK